MELYFRKGGKATAFLFFIAIQVAIFRRKRRPVSGSTVSTAIAAVNGIIIAERVLSVNEASKNRLTPFLQGSGLRAVECHR
jgi:hypothetical protein